VLSTYDLIFRVSNTQQVQTASAETTVSARPVARRVAGVLRAQMDAHVVRLPSPPKESVGHYTVA
jgi:hypothetical protein